MNVQQKIEDLLKQTDLFMAKLKLSKDREEFVAILTTAWRMSDEQFGVYVGRLI